MKTEDVIERLARELEPVAPLQRPWLRAAAWLGATLVYVALLAALMTSSTDARANGLAAGFLLPQVTAIVMGAAAAIAAFASVIPGAPTRTVIWPAVAIVAWLGTLLMGSVQDWEGARAIGLGQPREWLCVMTIAFGGTLPAIGMERMLRQGAPITPRTTMALAVLASASVANVAACVSHPHASNVVILVWHGITVAALVAAGAWAGRSLLSWGRIRRAM